MGSKGSGKQQVADYHLSLHLGICAGDVDEVVAVTIGEKDLGLTPTSLRGSVSGSILDTTDTDTTITDPVQPITSSTTVNIDKPSLFGGAKKGGGVRGSMHILFGEPTQKLTAFLASKLGRTPDTVTAYRGLLSLFFTGPGTDGFYWGSNNPVVPPVEVTVRRSPKGLSADSMIGPDANPAHILYECLTNDDWGIGESPLSVDKQSFLDAARQMKLEAFGLSFIWTQSTAVEGFVNDVLGHINGNLSFDLDAAKWRLKLLRGDYVESELKEVNPSNAKLVKFQRKAWGETVNEIVLTWTNPENEQDETVVHQDNSCISIQQSIISDSSKNYPGIRTQALALFVAERELKQASAPLAAAEVDVSKELWFLRPGDVVMFNWDEWEMDPIPMRVLKADYGKKGSPSVSLSLIEDIFGFSNSTIETQEGLFDDPSEQPVDVDQYRIFTPPYFLLANYLGDTDASAVEFPASGLILLASAPIKDIREIDVLSLVTGPTGTPEFEETTTVDEIIIFELPSAVDSSTPESGITLPSEVNGLDVPIGSLLMINSGADEEFGLVMAHSTSELTVRRGVLDTVPHSHPIGTAVYVVDANSRFVDPTEHVSGENVAYKLLPITSLGRLPVENATQISALVSDRTFLPLRPACVQVDGVSSPISLSETEPSLEITWKTRNRLTETSLILAWDDSSVPPETGQTTALRILKNGSEESVLSGLTGVLQTVSRADMGDPVNGDSVEIEVFSERESFISFQKYTIEVSITA